MPRRHSVKKHTPYQHAAPCGRKRAFRNEEEALVAIDDSLAATQLTTYLCPYCTKWHLSSSSKGDSAKR